MNNSFAQTENRVWKFSFVFCFFILLLSSQKVSAVHSVGADLTYTCLGGNDYLIHLAFYRDCFDPLVQAPIDAQIAFRSNSCGEFFFQNIPRVPGTGQEISPFCPSAVDSSTCRGGNLTGIQEWIYEGVVTLPQQCADWTFSFDLCCRNGAITTIVNPTNENIHISATLNNLITPCNNSTAFTNRPVPFVCLGQELFFNHGAYDPDGDSLVYNLITPRSGFNTTVNYFPPYAPSQPLNSVPAMSFDHTNGDFVITPQSMEVTVMAVEVSEYRNGVLIGSVERDIQVIVIPCTNNLPLLTGINGTNNFADTICAGTPFCFDIFSSDPDAAQTVTVAWDGSIPGATFTTTAGTRPNGHFCWTPTAADASNTHHCFTVTVSDDACPYIASQTFSYCITVADLSVNAGVDQIINCNATALINATSVSVGPGNVLYSWDNGILTAAQNVGTGTYTVTATNSSCTVTDQVQITSPASPTALYTSVSGCLYVPVTFTDQSLGNGGAITSWTWDFDDGNTSSLQSPSHLYTSDGNYNVCLIASSGNGCIDTICKNITVDPFPTASFNIVNVCEGTASNFVNNSIPVTVNSFWNFGNGDTSSASAPVYSYPVNGNYNVTLITVDSSGCSDTTVNPVTVYAPPVASYNFNATLCANENVSFTDLSGNNIFSWDWDFGDGQSSMLQNPSIVYADTGNYNVTLNVVSNDGCIDSIVQPVAVTPHFIAPSVLPDTICYGTSGTLAANGGASYLWSTGETTSLISASPLVNTVYTVSVTDGSGCVDTIVSAINVLSLPAVNAGVDDSICAGNPVNLSGSGADSYVWSPGGGTTAAAIVFPASNISYILSGTAINGCVNTDTMNVIVNPNLNVNSFDTFICQGDVATLDAGQPATGSMYAWSTGATTQTINVDTAGNFSVTVTDVFGCSGIGNGIVSVGGNGLVNNSSITDVCNGQIANISAGNMGLQYLWSTGETTQSINVDSGAVYNVIVTDADGCTITFNSTLIINPLPSPAFNVAAHCQYDSSYFINNSIISSGNIVSHQWNYGDGNSSALQQPNYFYSSPGTYNVTLTTTSDSGCVSSVSSNVIIHPVPVALITVPDNCFGFSTSFSSQSYVLNDTLYSLQWNLGDGSTLSGTTGTHMYSHPGDFSVQLIATTSHLCADTATEIVKIHPLPAASAGPDISVCSGDSVIMGDTLRNGLSYSWTPFVSIDNHSSAQPVYTYINSGLNNHSQTYYLTTTDGRGCVNHDTINIEVRPIPPVYFSSPPPQCLENNSFVFTPGGAVNANTALIWNFGDSTLQNSYVHQPSPVSYQSAGDHVVTLSYTYGSCPGIPTVDTVSVWKMPLADFMPSVYDGCIPLTVIFYNTPPEANTQYEWDINGNDLSGLLPQWTFTAPGIYTASVTGTSEHGCITKRNIDRPIEAYPLPVASYSNNPSEGKVYESMIQFYNTSLLGDEFEWNFGDGTYETFHSGSHFYSDTGTFDISLIVTSVHGCLDSVYGKVRINEGFSFFIPNALTPNGDGVNDYFQGYGTFLHSYQMSIYDRWGKKIYYTEDYEKPWDGHINSAVQNDTYVYRIVVSDYTGKEHVYLGDVSVVK